METVIHNRCLESALRSEISAGKVRIIFGARQTGKTVLLRRLLNDETSELINLQDSSLRRRLESDPSEFTRMIKALPGTIRQVGVDEIQKVPELLDEIQYLVDENPRGLQFVLTGSSARKLRGHSANLLPGRAHQFHLYPLIRGEEDDRGMHSIECPSAVGSGFAERSLAGRSPSGSAFVSDSGRQPVKYSMRWRRVAFCSMLEAAT